MRRLVCDQHEFDPPDSEQGLDVAIATLREFADAGQFLAACGTSANGETLKDRYYHPRWASVAENLKRLIGFELPSIEKCEVMILTDEWDELELLVQIGHRFLWYRWSTTA